MEQGIQALLQCVPRPAMPQRINTVSLDEIEVKSCVGGLVKSFKKGGIACRKWILGSPFI